MSRIGNVSVSSLVRSANASSLALANQNDLIQAQQWKNGNQTEEDFNNYKTYLQGRQSTLGASGSIAEQDKALGMHQTIINAQRTFYTNNVQNASIGIMQGQGSESDKLGLMAGQLRQAISNGLDPQTIQQLQQVYDSQTVKVQNEQVTAQNQASAQSAKFELGSTKAYAEALKGPSSIVADAERLFSEGKMNATQLYQTIGGASGPLAIKESLLTKAQNDPNLSSDHQTSFSTQLDSLKGTSSYKNFADPAVQNQMDNGVSVFTQKTDAYGRNTLQYKAVVGQQLKPDAQGILRPVNQTADNVNTASADAQYKSLGVPREVTINQGDGSHTLPVYIGQNGEGKAYAYFTQSDQKGGLHTVQLSADGSHAPIDNGVLPFPDQAQGIKKDGSFAGPNVPSVGSKVASGIDSVAGYGTSAGIKAIGDEIGNSLKPTFNSLKSLVPGSMPHNANPLDGALNALLNPLNAAMHPSQTANMFAAMVHQVTHSTPPPVAPVSPQSQAAYQQSNSPANPANRAAAYNNAHFTAPTPIAQGGNNINKVLTQPVPTNQNGSVNAPAAATKLVTGFGYGTGF